MVKDMVVLAIVDMIKCHFFCLVKIKRGSRGSPPFLHEKILKIYLIIHEINILRNIYKQEHCSSSNSIIIVINNV